MASSLSHSSPAREDVQSGGRDSATASPTKLSSIPQPAPIKPQSASKQNDVSAFLPPPSSRGWSIAAERPPSAHAASAAVPPAIPRLRLDLAPRPEPLSARGGPSASTVAALRSAGGGPTSLTPRARPSPRQVAASLRQSLTPRGAELHVSAEPPLSARSVRSVLLSPRQAEDTFPIETFDVLSTPRSARGAALPLSRPSEPRQAWTSLLSGPGPLSARGSARPPPPQPLSARGRAPSARQAPPGSGADAPRSAREAARAGDVQAALAEERARLTEKMRLLRLGQQRLKRGTQFDKSRGPGKEGACSVPEVFAALAPDLPGSSPSRLPSPPRQAPQPGAQPGLSSSRIPSPALRTALHLDALLSRAEPEASLGGGARSVRSAMVAAAAAAPEPEERALGALGQGRFAPRSSLMRSPKAKGMEEQPGADGEAEGEPRGADGGARGEQDEIGADSKHQEIGVKEAEQRVVESATEALPRDRVSSPSLALETETRWVRRGAAAEPEKSAVAPVPPSRTSVPVADTQLGLALLEAAEVRPPTGAALAGLLRAGCRVHKAWLRGTRPSRGSVRDLVLELERGLVLGRYRRGIFRGARSFAVHRAVASAEMWEPGQALVLHTDRGALRVCVDSAAAHARMVLGINALFASARGWEGDLPLDQFNWERTMSFR